MKKIIVLGITALVSWGIDALIIDAFKSTTNDALGVFCFTMIGIASTIACYKELRALAASVWS
jgi:hypothetical protein